MKVLGIWVGYCVFLKFYFYFPLTTPRASASELGGDNMRRRHAAAASQIKFLDQAKKEALERNLLMVLDELLNTEIEFLRRVKVKLMCVCKLLLLFLLL